MFTVWSVPALAVGGGGGGGGEPTVIVTLSVSVCPAEFRTVSWKVTLPVVLGAVNVGETVLAS